MRWHDTTRAGSAQLGAILTLGCVLLGTSLCWFVLDPLKYAVIDAHRQGMSAAAAAKSALLELPSHALVLLAAASLVLLLAVLAEYRGRVISTALAGSSRLASSVAFAAILLWFGHSYLYGGHLLGGDTGAHVARIAHFAEGLRHGEIRHWDNAFYAGATFLQFTGPLFFWLGGGAAWLIGDPVIAVKAVLLALHFGSGWALYRLLRQAALSRPAAAAAAIIYAGAFAHLHLILYKGALPQAVTLALLPLSFLAAEKLVVARKHFGSAWGLLVLAVAGLVVAHQPHGVFAGLYLAAFVLAGIACRRFPWTVLPRFATAAAASGLVASFSVVPWLAEAENAMAGAGGVAVFWVWPDWEYAAKLMVWGNQWTSPGAESAAYVGLTSIGLAAVAIIAACCRGTPIGFRRQVLILAGLLAVSFCLRGAFVRDIIFTLFFIALLAGFGAEVVLTWRRNWSRLAMIIVVVLLFDLGTAAIQPVARLDKAYLDEAGAYLGGQLPPRRTVLTNDYGTPGQITVEIGPAAGPINYRPVQTLSGPHNMAATRFHNYGVAMLKRTESDLRQEGKLGPRTAALLAMMNVGTIANDHGTGMGLPQQVTATTEDGPLGRNLEVDHPTPAVFAPHVVSLIPPQHADKPALWGTSFTPDFDSQAQTVAKVLDDYLDAMQLDPATACAAAIPVRLPSNDVPSQAEATPLPGANFAVQDYVVEAQRVLVRLQVPAPGFVQLAHPWYPHQSVFVDGREVERLRSTIDLIVVALEPGEHEIEIVAVRSPLRTTFGLASAMIAAAVLAISFWPRTRRYS